MKPSVVRKLWRPLILNLVCFAGASVYSAYHRREMRVAERKADPIHASMIALSVVKPCGEDAATGAVRLDSHDGLCVDDLMRHSVRRCTKASGFWWYWPAYHRLLCHRAATADDADSRGLTACAGAR
ncbi:hypothetical protein [Paraburkholderia sp.]|jgi:hypothetical protein|uniref:hypothetical protein n=1 Tax=Paraburkholderia sp. TaxID=1926495 RepID=UPI002F428CAD